jgi:polar amino acid transport system substrate-binding protein
MKDRVNGRLGRRVTLSVLVVSVALVAAACSKSSNTGTGTNSPTSSAGGKDAAIAAEVAAAAPAIASKGTLTVATDATYAPNEFIDPTSQQIQGMDVDLGTALATVMGLKADFVNAGFDTIIPGLASGKYDLGMSSFTDTLERQKTVDFVTYFTAGTSFYTAASGGPTLTGLDSLCGLTVAAERGTTQAADVTAQGPKCTAAGKTAPKLSVFGDQNGANLALSSGRVQVVMADSPVAAYAVQQSSGAFVLAGTPYGTAPYGIAIPRDPSVAAGSAPLSKPVLDALNKLIADGTYLQILTKWGVQDGAITSPAINGATS